MTAGNHVVVGIATDVFSIEIRYFNSFSVADRNTGVPSLVPLLTDSTELQTSRPPDRVIRDQYAYLPAVSPMVDLLWTIQSSRPGVQRLADKLTIFVPLVTILAITTALGTLMIGESPTTAFLTVLIIPVRAHLDLNGNTTLANWEILPDFFRS